MPRSRKAWGLLPWLVLAAGCNGLLGNDVGHLAPPDAGGAPGTGGGGTGGSAATAGGGGAAGAGAISVVPTSHKFGSVPFGHQSPPASFVLTDSGGTPTGTLQIAITGADATDFSQTNNCPTTLTSQASCTVQVTVKPGKLGALAATLAISANPGGSASASLTAQGEQAYNPLASASWTTFDATAVGAEGFQGATFDGRYVYFVPWKNASGQDGIVTRYDTHASFSNQASWGTFDTTTVNSGAKGFVGGAFDKRYVYLVPNFNGVFDGIVTRYDTQKPFASGSSWETFDTTTVDPGAMGFAGATFDGRYLYFVPYANYNGAYDGIVARYDTTVGFGAKSSWTTFDTATVDPGAKSFNGAIFDGRYIYFVPNFNGTWDGIVARYDTSTADFTNKSSWVTYDTTLVNPDAKCFLTGAFDGRYLYLLPYRNGSGYDGIAVRYDTTAAFTAKSSWETFDTTTVDNAAAGYFGAAFDGRYLYLVPFRNNTGYDGLVVRYDTNAAFTAKASWEVFNTNAVFAGAKGFHNAVFDGRYVYFAPFNNGTLDGIVARFDATQPPVGIPQLCNSNAALYCYSGSFF